LTTAKDAYKAAGGVLLEKNAALANWNNGKMITVEQFKDYGKMVVQDGLTYYTDKFIAPSGRYYDIMQCYRAASLFDPIKAQEKTVQQLESLVDELAYFKFTKFSPIFLNRMKKEIPIYLALARNPAFDWDELPGAKDWALAEQKGGGGRIWQDDKAEVARRIWEWWRLHREKFTYFKDAVRLVVLVQVSSASIERVFSRLRLILDMTQQHVLHDAVLLRLMLKINRKYNN
jgi:hypothetical protein